MQGGGEQGPAGEAGDKTGLFLGFRFQRGDQQPEEKSYAKDAGGHGKFGLPCKVAGFRIKFPEVVRSHQEQTHEHVNGGAPEASEAVALPAFSTGGEARADQSGQAHDGEDLVGGVEREMVPRHTFDEVITQDGIGQNGQTEGQQQPLFAGEDHLGFLLFGGGALGGVALEEFIGHDSQQDYNAENAAVSYTHLTLPTILRV